MVSQHLKTVTCKVCYQGWDVNPAGLAPESRLVITQGAAQPLPSATTCFLSQLPAPSSQLPADEWPQSQHRAPSSAQNFSSAAGQKGPWKV